MSSRIEVVSGSGTETLVRLKLEGPVSRVMIEREETRDPVRVLVMVKELYAFIMHSINILAVADRKVSVEALLQHLDGWWQACEIAVGKTATFHTYQENLRELWQRCSGPIDAKVRAWFLARWAEAWLSEYAGSDAALEEMVSAINNSNYGITLETGPEREAIRDALSAHLTPRVTRRTRARNIFDKLAEIVGTRSLDTLVLEVIESLSSDAERREAYLFGSLLADPMVGLNPLTKEMEEGVRGAMARFVWQDLESFAKNLRVTMMAGDERAEFWAPGRSTRVHGIIRSYVTENEGAPVPHLVVKVTTTNVLGTTFVSEMFSRASAHIEEAIPPLYGKLSSEAFLHVEGMDDPEHSTKSWVTIGRRPKKTKNESALNEAPVDPDSIENASQD